MKNKKFLILSIISLIAISISTTDVSGHGGGEDRAPEINFENRDVTVIAKMSPSDMTVGNFSNAFMEVQFVEVFKINSDKKIENQTCIEQPDSYLCKNDIPIKQTTFAISVLKDQKLLARNNFYAENGVMIIDIRPNDKCDVKEETPWKCTKYYGTKHPLVVEALYTLGQNNPVIDGPIFTKGGLYEIKVQVIGAESPRSNLKEPLEFNLFVSIAQEQTFWIDLVTGQIFDKPIHLR